MAGLLIRDNTGRAVLDMTTNVSQDLGSVVTNGANGSFLLPNPPTGRSLFFWIVPLVNMDGWRAKLPGVSLVGNVMTWSYAYPTNGWGFFSANCRIHYGYY